jgi:hypothetical protein
MKVVLRAIGHHVRTLASSRDPEFTKIIANIKVIKENMKALEQEKAA